ncbi:hypothetical protein [Stutzerimonas kunmingensis]|uniref:hypothetical protein n=1 Tax=Stutzerimonas kunmingensis TaxID=1211807 RepID=UPI0024201E4F|nr:hypothetical protein [Stutzerimonas kunmingensis]
MARIERARASIRVELHPAAKAAYTWIRDLPRWVNLPEVPASLRAQLAVQPIEGVMNQAQFRLYAPLWQALIWPEHQPPAGTLLICMQEAEITETEIERSAWVSALGSLLQAVEPRSISEVRDRLSESMPIRLHKELLGSRTLSDVTLSRWTGGARSTLSTQRKQKRSRAAQPEVPKSPRDILAELNAEWQPSD